ncbi:hypothetical protein SAMN05421678_112160 [Actinopolymorpha cephalotaxi]|uniref:Uncharacterized protein n=1 Tax=Actinopolymorpha cephalotaxi TaxID=504797 RepID=A0A1I2XH93_9ACTN|nr:hypothetical protein [Actinopolymorpha cephalotaxi]NYH86225.1 hypothetical protein [Actinopolymorpha cephalotaxi]SFH12066.1 hypothetical protein SAMN05421678_112160 [Actinopolymorpha cephalotaxi]
MLAALILVVLLALTVGGPAVCLVAAVVLATRVVRLLRGRAGDRRGLGSVSSLGWLAVLVSVGTVEAYALGALKYSPGLFPDKTCYFTMGARAFPESSDLLPLSTVCRGQEIVPFWFNPLMAVLAVVSVALLAAVPFAYARRRRTAAATGATSASGASAGSGAPEAAVSPASERAE